MGIWWRGCSRYAGLFHECKRYGLACSVSGCKTRLDRAKMVNALHRESYILPYSQPCAQFLYAKGYAVLARAKPKEEGLKEQAKQPANEPEGPRINKAITADVVRLVTDKGHQVVPRQQALDYAKKLKLDLVEVQRNAKPPVCKVMDFHKEKYKQQQREKDRTKNKSELTIRKGECREVRFTAKTEQKDLERKAEMAKRLMDRGYRVKCMAMGTEAQNLEELLMRLSTLIEDVSIVEAAPKIEKRQAWMIVRHIKFGPAKKKAGQQTAKIVESTEGETEVKGNIVQKPIESKDQGYASVVLQKEEVEEWEPSEESDSFEQFEELEAEGVPVIDRVEEIPTDLAVHVSLTNEMNISPKEFVKQVGFSVHDVGPDTTMLAELGNSDTKQHIAVNHVKQTLSDNSPIREGNHASNTGKHPPPDFLPQRGNDPIKDGLEDTFANRPGSAPLRSQMDFVASKIISQVQPLSASLNVCPSKQDQIGISDARHNISEHDTWQIMDEKSTVQQGQCASNIGNPVYSTPKLVDSSLEAKIDTPNHDSIDMPLISEAYAPTSNIVGQVQTLSVDSNNDTAIQGKQDLSNDRIHVSSNDRKNVLVDSSSVDKGKHVLVDSSSVDKGKHVSKTGKQVQPTHVDGDDNATQQDEPDMLKAKYQVLGDKKTGHIPNDQVYSASNIGKQKPIDSLPNAANVSGASHWGIFGQAKSAAVNLNKVAPVRDQIRISNAINNTPSDDSRQVPSLPKSDRSGKFASNNKRQTPADFPPKQAIGLGESQSVVSKHVLSSSVDVNSNATSRDQLGISNSRTPVIEDKQEMSSDRNHVAGNDLKHVLVDSSSSNQGLYASKSGKELPVDTLPKQANDSAGSLLGILKQVQPTHVDGDSATPQDELGILKTKHHVLDDNTTGQIPSDQVHYAPNTGKQKPIDSLPSPANISVGSRWGIFGQVKSSAVNANNVAPVQDQIGISNARKSVPNVDSRQDRSVLRSDVLENFASNNKKQTAVDLAPKQATGLGESQSVVQKRVLPSSVNANSSVTTSNQCGISNSKTPVLEDDTRQVLTAHSPSGKGSHASTTGKQAPNSSFSKDSHPSGPPCWGIFGAQDRASVDNKRHSEEVIKNQSEKDEPDTTVGSRRQVLAGHSPRGNGSHVSTTGKQAPNSSFSKHSHSSEALRWGIFSAPDSVGVDNQMHSEEVARDQVKKDEPDTPVGSSIFASSKARTKTDPRHLFLQNQRQAPSRGNDAPKQPVDKSKQTGWGIFSMRPGSVNKEPTTKPTEVQMKSEG